MAVFGLGAVGFGALFAAKGLGIETIIAVDLIPARLELALALGATHVFQGSDPDIVAAIKAVTPHNAGPMFAVEATGNMRVLRTAHAALSNRGHLLRCVHALGVWKVFS